LKNAQNLEFKIWIIWNYVELRKKYYKFFPCDRMQDVTDIRVHGMIQKCVTLFDQKGSAKSLSASRFHVRSFSLLPGWREGSIKKRHWIRSTTLVLPSRMIDRSIGRNTMISTPDLLALVQLGEICENVCATIGSWPILPLPMDGF